MKHGDLTKNPLNLIDIDKPKTIWDPKSEFMKELELYKLRSEIKPRKVNMMRSQANWMGQMCKEAAKPQLYVPGKDGFLK